MSINTELKPNITNILDFAEIKGGAIKPNSTKFRRKRIKTNTIKNTCL